MIPPATHAEKDGDVCVAAIIAAEDMCAFLKDRCADSDKKTVFPKRSGGQWRALRRRLKKERCNCKRSPLKFPFSV
jgi:hypothetical protein